VTTELKPETYENVEEKVVENVEEKVKKMLQIIILNDADILNVRT